MRTIRGVALGTYYAVGADAASATPNAAAMRGLIYAVKDNRTPPNRPQLIAHPRHPAGAPVLVDRRNAIEYITYRSRLAARFGARPDEITLVPVPSSSSAITSKPATCDQLKSGHFGSSGTEVIYCAAAALGKFAA